VSLCAHVLRAKYSPQGSVLNAEPVQGMSCMWRSILKGVSLLKEGMIWRVGTCTNIRVWANPWIPRDHMATTSPRMETDTCTYILF
jgi:hypothetical protein